MQNVFPYWRQLPAAERRLLVEQSVVMAFPKGTMVANPLKKELGIRIVLEGRLRISIQTEWGGELLLYQLATGEVCKLSILSLMRKFNHDLCVETMQESKILMVPGRICEEVAGRNPVMSEYDQQQVLEHLTEVIGIVSEYALATTEQRLVGLLLRYRKVAANDVLHVTHESLARDIGTAREVVSRLLKQLERQGHIAMGRGQIRVNNAAGLEALKYAGAR